jgi:hypothetical protein
MHLACVTSKYYEFRYRNREKKIGEPLGSRSSPAFYKSWKPGGMEGDR